MFYQPSPVNVSKRRRNNKVLFKNRYVKYPFENGLSGLPILDNIACLAGFSSAAFKRRFGKTHKAENLQDWCLRSFGKGISEKYLLPYNAKIWKYPPKETSTGWVERIPNPPWKDVFKSSLGIETEGYKHQLYFSYPTAGGIQSIIEGMTDKFRDRIVTSFEVKSVTRKNGKWVVSDGKREKEFDAIVSTLPLPTLADVVDLPPDINSAIESLNVNSIVCVLLGGVEPVIKDLTAIYIPDKNALTHRVSFMSTFSDNVAPPGKTSATADITCRFNDDTWNARDEDLIERTVKDLVSIGVLKSSKREVSLVSRHKFAYVIDDKNRAANVAKIRRHLTEQGILTCGRFAEFEYLNMDAVAAHAFAFLKEHKPKLASAG